MKISLGTDHAGFRYKEKVKELLVSLGHEVKDFGTWSEEPVDYPLFIRPAAQAVAKGECDRGIVFGGSGNGEAMAANKVRGVRCALCWNEESAKLSRQHNDANVLSLGERMIPEELALEIVRIWLRTPFEGGRHAKRIAELELCTSLMPEGRASARPGHAEACSSEAKRRVYNFTQQSRQTAATKTALTNALLWKKARFIPATIEFFRSAMFVKKCSGDERSEQK